MTASLSKAKAQAEHDEQQAHSYGEIHQEAASACLGQAKQFLAD